jgi:hypothetical protein
MPRDWSNDPADLIQVIMTTFGVDRFTASGYFHHGHVTINGYTLCARDAHMRWRKRQVAGKLMKCPMGTVRLYGTTAATSEIVSEQLKLGR